MGLCHGRYEELCGMSQKYAQVRDQWSMRITGDLANPYNIPNPTCHSITNLTLATRVCSFLTAMLKRVLENSSVSVLYKFIVEMNKFNWKIGIKTVCVFVCCMCFLHPFTRGSKLTALSRLQSITTC